MENNVGRDGGAGIAAGRAGCRAGVCLEVPQALAGPDLTRRLPQPTIRGRMPGKRHVRSPRDLSGLSRRILRLANRGVGRVEFLREVSKLLIDFSCCDALELRLRDPSLHYRWEATRRPQRSFRFVILGNGQARESVERPEEYPSVVRIRFTVNDHTTGVLALKSFEPRHFAQKDLHLYHGFAQTFALAIANRRAQWALRERVKELTCLYGIAQVAQWPDSSLGQTLQGIVELLPPAWQYPRLACARIILDGRTCQTPDFREGPHRQEAAILVCGVRRGAVEVVYTGEQPEFIEGPFLKEERSLIDTVAREVSLIVERREAEEHKTRLQSQLRHADRLATIGQLAAGVAHELNEPLANILGFAQLARKHPGLPERAAGDLEKIVGTALHAREIIHKLLVFARQGALEKTRMNLNHLVEGGLYFLESRCVKAGIELIRALAPDLPDIIADSSQLNQVLVNLVVNAVQAMPGGGRLTIETRAGQDCVSLVVQDTGAGMTEEVKSKIFTPFFTTKDVNEGTGLGLAVVHGIVAAHGGSIRVDSAPSQGARFEIQLPLKGQQ